METQKQNFRASKIRSNMPSIQLRLAKIYAIDTFRTGMTNLKSTGFTKQEIQNLMHEFFDNSFPRSED